MHIHIVPNRDSPPTVLLRESYREGAKVGKRTLANLSSLSSAQVEAIRAILRGDRLQPVAQCFEITASRPHGHVQAVNAAMQRLGFASVIASKPCRERDLVLSMVASRILAPHTKLATTRWWHTTTLAEDFGVADANEDELYAAMDWLLKRQDRIQKKLGARHLSSGGLVLYDLSSSYFEGDTCPLAKRGYSRDGKPGKLQVNYGLLTDALGCPVAVSVHEGNTSDSTTFMPEVQRLRQDFHLDRMVMVGDRGMISQKAIDEMRDTDGIGWITALKSVSIRSLVAQAHLQLGLFDERNLLELSSPDFPGERLVACRNAQLAKLRTHKRDSIDAQTALDGLYIIRTSVPATQMEGADCVRNYKSPANVERAFRSLKTIDLKVRPIHHRTADPVRSHIFLCMLAYYVEWHLRDAWRELMFADPDQQAKTTRDPVAPAKRSKAALAKVARHTLNDGTPAHSFCTLLAELGTIVGNTCRTPGVGSNAPNFDVITTPNLKQARALELLKNIHV